MWLSHVPPSRNRGGIRRGAFRTHSTSNCASGSMQHNVLQRATTHRQWNMAHASASVPAKSGRHPAQSATKHDAISGAVAFCALLQLPRQCYVFSMTTAEDIEKAVEQLAPRELARFRA